MTLALLAAVEIFESSPVKRMKLLLLVSETFQKGKGSLDPNETSVNPPVTILDPVGL
jgi:hypothetical protein